MRFGARFIRPEEAHYRTFGRDTIFVKNLPWPGLTKPYPMLISL
jgi:hypothetical protein